MGLISPREYIDLIGFTRNYEGGLHFTYGESCDHLWCHVTSI